MRPAPPLRIAVTAADLRLGVRGPPDLHPVALAAGRVIPSGSCAKVIVQPDTPWGTGRTLRSLWVVGVGRRSLTSYRFPPRAVRWLESLEAGEEVSPARFTLRTGTVWS